MATAKTTEKKEERVKIKLFKDNGRYKDDVFVSLNNYTAVIKRGEYVEIPKEVADVIEQSMSQQEIAMSYIEELETDFEGESKKRNL